MKIAITGHTKGIGLGIKEYFESKGHCVIGFSKSTGFDISYPSIREKIINLSEDCDIFVNNAYCNFNDSQISLLKKIYQHWENTDKTIINISSRYTEGNNLYNIHKRRLDDFCAENVYHNPRIINLKPGLVNTERASNIKNPKMEIKDVIDVLDWVLSQNLKIHSVSFGK